MHTHCLHTAPGDECQTRVDHLSFTPELLRIKHVDRPADAEVQRRVVKVQSAEGLAPDGGRCHFRCTELSRAVHVFLRKIQL